MEEGKYEVLDDTQPSDEQLKAATLYKSQSNNSQIHSENGNFTVLHKRLGFTHRYVACLKTTQNALCHCTIRYSIIALPQYNWFIH